jgi:hypothetical protein
MSSGPGDDYLHSDRASSSSFSVSDTLKDSLYSMSMSMFYFYASSFFILKPLCVIFVGTRPGEMFCELVCYFKCGCGGFTIDFCNVFDMGCLSLAK